MPSTIVTTIYDALVSKVSTTLGASYHELPRKYSPEEGDFLTINQGYAVVQSGSSPFSVPDQGCYIMDQRFEVLICDRSVDRGDDSDKSDAINSLYNKAHDLTSAIHNTTFSIADVLRVRFADMGAPEFFDNGLVLIRLGFSVKYAQAVS